MKVPGCSITLLPQILEGRTLIVDTAGILLRALMIYPAMSKLIWVFQSPPSGQLSRKGLVFHSAQNMSAQLDETFAWTIPSWGNDMADIVWLHQGEIIAIRFQTPATLYHDERTSLSGWIDPQIRWPILEKAILEFQNVSLALRILTWQYKLGPFLGEEPSRRVRDPQVILARTLRVA
eukprot:2107857-Rhodomonas_salina.1